MVFFFISFPLGGGWRKIPCLPCQNYSACLFATLRCNTRLYGFQSGENPGLHPDAAARFLMTIAPPVLMIISFAFSWLINFKKPAEAPEAAAAPAGD